jgi:hypothetical protein
MFTLDDLIRSAVQSAINILAPEHTSVLCVQEVKNLGSAASSSSNLNFSAAHQHQQHQLQSSSGPLGGQYQSHQQQGGPIPESPSAVETEHQRCLDLNHQHRLYTEQIRKIYEDLVNMDREYKELLELSLIERRRNVERLALSGSVAGGGWSASTSDILPLNGGTADSSSKVDSGCEMGDDAVLVNGGGEEECNGVGRLVEFYGLCFGL